LVFLMVRGEWHLFAWRYPAGYMAVSDLWHVLNAGLLWVLLRQHGRSRLAAWSGAALFLLIPWAAETYFWVSARFDLVSTSGVLACLVAGRAVADEDRRSIRTLTLLIGLMAGSVAIFAKESGLVVVLSGPLLVLGGRPKAWKSLPLYETGLVAIALAYLLLRQKVLPAFGTAYGSPSDVYSRASLVANILSHVRALVTAPVPWVPPEKMPPAALLAVIGCAAGIGLVVTWRRLSASTMFGVVLFLAAVMPVAWHRMPIESSAAGRFAYLPGAAVAFLFALVLDSLRSMEKPWVAGGAVLVSTCAVFSYAGISVSHQFSVWRQAVNLARTVVDQFESTLNKPEQNVFVTNLPFWFADGPYVLKDYAFSYYFAGRPVPRVRARNMVVAHDRNGLRFAGFADAPQPSPLPLEFILTLKLPGLLQQVEDAVIEPSRVSLFTRTGSGRGAGNWSG
jgi:hypothetical protein